MQFINLNDIEQIVLSKFKIEEYLLKEKKIEEKQHINDYITMITKDMWSLDVDNKTIISFYILCTEDEQYVYVITNDESELKLLTIMLGKIDYDLSKLKEFNPAKETQKFFFIKNNTYYKI